MRAALLANARPHWRGANSRWNGNTPDPPRPVQADC